MWGPAQQGSGLPWEGGGGKAVWEDHGGSGLHLPPAPGSSVLQAVFSPGERHRPGPSTALYSWALGKGPCHWGWREIWLAREPSRHRVTVDEHGMLAFELD